MILPAYAMQTASRVAGYAETWALFQEAIPRNIFPNLQLPLLFAIFSKDRRRTMVGFALYREVAALQQIERKYRDMLNATGKSVWRDLVAETLHRLGGRAHLDAIYAEVEGRRPSATKWWREGMRRTLRRHTDLFRSHGGGVYSLAVV